MDFRSPVADSHRTLVVIPAAYLLWQEYRESHSDGYEYSRFCERYQLWAGHLGVTMRQAHIAGEKCLLSPAAA